MVLLPFCLFHQKPIPFSQYIHIFVCMGMDTFVLSFGMINDHRVSKDESRSNPTNQRAMTVLCVCVFVCQFIPPYHSEEMKHSTISLSMSKQSNSLAQYYLSMYMYIQMYVLIQRLTVTNCIQVDGTKRHKHVDTYSHTRVREKIQWTINHTHDVTSISLDDLASISLLFITLFSRASPFFLHLSLLYIVIQFKLVYCVKLFQFDHINIIQC